MRSVVIILFLLWAPAQSLGAEIKLSESRAHRYVIDISGPIESGDAGKFVAQMVRFIELKDKTALLTGVTLNSEGGSVEDAIKIAELVHGSGGVMAAVAYDKCLSACAMILFSTDKRGVYDAQVRVGVHRVHREDLTEDASTRAQTQEVAKVFRQLGVSDVVAEREVNTPPRRMYYLTKSDMVASGLVIAND